ncbi:MAG TPA: tryptophan synthase subunit alpha [Sphingobacteriaceae bacterium]|nr:tryptophan synthase subunit alpha [Sphingobacteriaceae bacterium]
MSRVSELFNNENSGNKLSIYYTAGYPNLESTIEIAESLEKAGVDFLEIGIPYSDPVADGPVIQESSGVALKNGMSIQVLFDQLAELRTRVSIPVFLMGYFNPVLQYGVERFCEKCAEVGVDGVIIPDLPLYEYKELYQDIFERNGVSNVFIVTPQTAEERIREIDALSNAFIYLISSSATTGKNLKVSEESSAYFKRMQSMDLKTPLVIGFGISNHETFVHANKYTDAAIIGTAFVRVLGEENYLEKIPSFVKKIKEG